MKKWSYYILPLFFFGFIYLMFFNQIFGWKEYKNEDENRKLAEFPTVYFKHLDQYPGQFDDYLQDNYTLRAPFLKAYHEWMFQLGISPDADKVLVGKNDQLFLAEKDLDAFKGRRAFNAKRLDSLRVKFDEKAAYLSQKNLPFYWLICPYKLHVYPEDLPIGVRERGGNRSIQIQTYLSKYYPEKIAYPLEQIVENKKDAYFKYDNHWTEKGAFYAYLEVMELMKKGHPSLVVLTSDDVVWEMDTARKSGLLNFIGKTGELTEMVPNAIIAKSKAVEAEKLGFKVTEGFPYPWDYEHYFTNSTALNSQKILVITDSFGEALHPFFSASFRETLFIFNAWQYSISQEIIDKFQPDIVVFVTMESLIDNILEHPAVAE